MRLRVLLLALVSFLLLADPPMTRLRVDVKTLGGKPIERASVILDFQEGRSVAKLGVTAEVNHDSILSTAALEKGLIGSD